MRRFILSILLGAMVLAPVAAQSRKAVKQAKKDTKIEVKQLKADGYKSLDNVKLDEVVNRYLTSLYSTKNSTEVIGKAENKDLNIAKAEARTDALYGYPEDDVVDSFFVYRKTRNRALRWLALFTGSRMITALSFILRVEAASIQYPFQPVAMSLSYMLLV